jgi:hypothetical protein
MLNGSRGSEIGWLELGKGCVSVTVEVCVSVVVDHSGGLVNVLVSVRVTDRVSVLIEISGGKVVGNIKVEVTGAAVVPDPGMTRFFKAT